MDIENSAVFAAPNLSYALSKDKMYRAYTPRPVVEKMPTEEEIQKILKTIGKSNSDKEFNCGACGYPTCRDKAIAIYQGKAESSMCLLRSFEMVRSKANVVMETTPNLIFIFDRELRIREFNRRAEEVFDTDRRKALQMYLFDFIDPSDFENVLKTNDSLKFAVLTGCLRVAKESIFTGLNNFKVCSITDSDFDEAFGFIDSEVKSILQYYGQETHYTEVKEWYDGYRFGKADVYCPWDVLNYCRDLLKDEQAQPKNYWLNTSGNDVIEHFIDSVNGQQTLTKIELERLISGEIVQKEINEFITYKELYNTSENLWSTLFMTGYLTQRGKADGNRYNLVIPNREVRNIITEHILVKFRQDIKKDGQMVQRFCQALANGQAQQVEQIFATYMSKTVSVRDTFVRKAIRENFYHGILLGILSFKDGWTVTSNRESGNGFSDILIQIDDSDIGIVIEVKYTEEGKSMESDCKAALKQIDEKNYTETLYQAGVKRILKYGIACQIKDCKVMLEE